MKNAPKILGFLLIGVLALRTGVWAEPEQAPASSQHANACHSHGRTLPDSPQPASHRCCLTGHDAAAVQVSQLPQPSGARLAPALQHTSFLYSLNELKIAAILFAGPPGSPPLRI
jgi:hypothetical protein